MFNNMWASICGIEYFFLIIEMKIKNCTSNFVNIKFNLDMRIFSKLPKP